MRRPLLQLFCTFAFCSFALANAQASNLDQQRQMYDEAKRALSKGDKGPYLRYSRALSDYPLTPYLAYDELSARLESASNTEVETFLNTHGDLPQANWIKRRWLHLLADTGQWQLFAKHYDASLGATDLECLYGQYLYKQPNRRSEAQAAAEKLWLVGKSQPEACDALFSTWRADGQLTEERRWQRARLAAEARNYGLASYLVKGLTNLAPQGRLMLDVAQKPQLMSQTERFTATDPHTIAAVSLGLRRLARQTPEQARDLLEIYADKLPLSGEDKAAIAREIGLTLARSFDIRALQVMARYDPQLRDATLAEWRARLLLRNNRWDEAYQLIGRMPEELANSTRWRYWRARSLQLAKPHEQQALALYKSLATERDFYGFLAADRIQAPYSLNNRPMAIEPQVMQKVRNTSGIRRALEFYQRGQIVDARREWYHASRLFNREELVAQARLAYEQQWYFPAIRSISQARYWDDLDIRFPMAHRDSLSSQARLRGLHSSWVFAITRQESAFMADARSGVGAMGLMQLMPATARETARKFGIALSNPQQALQPEKNIQLGAAYLSQVYGQFNGNRVLASAAYNAGPRRVRQWLQGADHLPFDIWVENIPFDETRQYVQNVLSYAVIYGQKLNAPQPLVDPHERFFDD